MVFVMLAENAWTLAGIAGVFFVVYKAGEYHASELQGYWTSEDVHQGFQEKKRALLRGMLQTAEKVKGEIFGSSEE